MSEPTIALLTDFGTQDTYVGVMKGVMARIAPAARIIDIAHHVPPGDIRRGAFQLWQAAAYFPPGTIFVGVVDPGVGTERRPIAAAWPERRFVGPDNGLATFLLTAPVDPVVVELREPRYRLPRASSTFHGRDVFAPAAAHLARGIPIRELGPEVHDLVRLPWPALRVAEDVVEGEVLHADRFGNLVTSVGRLSAEAGSLRLDPWIPVVPPTQLASGRWSVEWEDGRRLPLRRTFGDVAQGEVLAYVGSEGLIEIGINRGRAAERLGLVPGTPVRLIREG